MLIYVNAHEIMKYVTQDNNEEGIQCSLDLVKFYVKCVCQNKAVKEKERICFNKT